MKVLDQSNQLSIEISPRNELDVSMKQSFLERDSQVELHQIEDNNEKSIEEQQIEVGEEHIGFTNQSRIHTD